MARNTITTILAIAGTVGGATADLHIHVSAQVAGVRAELADRIRELDTKMDTLVRDVGRLEGLILGLHGIKVISDESSLSGPEHVAKPRKHQ